MAVTKRKLIPYAGYERHSTVARTIPVKRAAELRERGMSWKQVAWELSVELKTLDQPFTADGIYAAVARVRKRELA